MSRFSSIIKLFLYSIAFPNAIKALHITNSNTEFLSTINFDEISSVIDALKIEELISVSEDIFRSDNLFLSVVGPIEDKEVFRDRMNL